MILSREQTLELLSEFATSDVEPMRDRLKAVEILAKIQGFLVGTAGDEHDDGTEARSNLLALFNAETKDSSPGMASD